MLFGYTPFMGQSAGIFVCVQKSTGGLLYKQFAESGKAQALITLEPNKRSVEQCLEKGLPTQPLKLRLVRVELEDGEVEVLITNLTDERAFPACELKELYHLRWGAEIDQPCCLHKSFLRKLLHRFCDWFYPGTINSPQFT